MKKTTSTLAGKLLISSPNIGDPYFYRSVIYVIEHNEKGAMGLVLNHVAEKLSIYDIFKSLNLEWRQKQLNLNQHAEKIFLGGPIEVGRGFILHSNDWQDNTSLFGACHIFGVTATLDIIRAIARNKGPKDFRFVLGYVGWRAGQLEKEMQDNAWLFGEAKEDLLSKIAPHKLYQTSLKNIGVDISKLSSIQGYA